jgi:hypothetical protein
VIQGKLTFDGAYESGAEILAMGKFEVDFAIRRTPT